MVNQASGEGVEARGFSKWLEGVLIEVVCVVTVGGKQCLRAARKREGRK